MRAAAGWNRSSNAILSFSCWWFLLYKRTLHMQIKDDFFGIHSTFQFPSTNNGVVNKFCVKLESLLRTFNPQLLKIDWLLNFLATFSWVTRKKDYMSRSSLVLNNSPVDNCFRWKLRSRARSPFSVTPNYHQWKPSWPTTKRQHRSSLDARVSLSLSTPLIFHVRSEILRLVWRVFAGNWTARTMINCKFPPVGGGAALY